MRSEPNDVVTPLGERGRSVFLVLEGLAKIFGSNKAVDDVSLSIPEGEFFTIVGPSGSGKSTLIRILAGLETPTAGRVLLRGADITVMPANRRPTCMVFQSLALFNHMSVGDNIGFALKMLGIDAAERHRRVETLLDFVRLPQDFLGKPVTQCSGGEKQRVALARALASDPEILFFDEPLSAIDYRLRKILEVEMKDLHRRTGKTFIYITHSLEEAMVMSDRICLMNDARIEQIGTPQELYFQPKSVFAADFLGESNLLPATVRESTRDGTVVEVASGATVRGQANPTLHLGERVRFMVRPESVRISDGGDAENSVEGVLKEIIMSGQITKRFLELPDGSEMVSTRLTEGGGDSAVTPGATVRFGWSAEHTVVLPDSEEA